MWLDVVFKSALEPEETLGEKWLCSLFWLCASVFSTLQWKKEKGKLLYVMMWKSRESWATLQQKRRDLFIKMLLVSHPNTLLLLQESTFLCCCFLHSLFILNELFPCCFSPRCLSCSVHMSPLMSFIWAAVLKPSPSCWLLIEYLWLATAVRLPSRYRGCNIIHWAFAAPTCSTRLSQLMQEWVITFFLNCPNWSPLNITCVNYYRNDQKVITEYNNSQVLTLSCKETKQGGKKLKFLRNPTDHNYIFLLLSDYSHHSEDKNNAKIWGKKFFFLHTGLKIMDEIILWITCKC